MTKNCSKKLVLLKTYYYRFRNQQGQSLANSVTFITNPLTASDDSVVRMTDKNYNPVENKVINFVTLVIPTDNPISGITTQYFNESFIINTKCSSVSAIALYPDSGVGSTTTTVKSVDYPVTASSGKLKNAVLVRIEFDNNGDIFSNGVKFARRVSIFGYK